ncbi:deubiquitinating enzyme [Globomyces sp. JEL0801]|nr:deubiquitinating enzyme [Globomyces sp. JEL0801]
MVHIIIKWNGKKYDLDVDVSQNGLTLKTQIFSLTGVAPDRQKIMVKGGMLKDDTALDSLKLKENQQLMMMGTVGDLLKEPVEKIAFIEDMTESELSKALKLPAGLVNLGNTCYLNSTLQCLMAIPELSSAIDRTSISMGVDTHTNFAVSMNSLFKELKSSGTPIQPIMFVQILRTLFPQFQERDRNGFMQQDAEECWGQTVQALSEKVVGLKRDLTGDPSKKFVDQYMTTEFLVESRCDAAPSETPTITIDSANKIRVNIGAGVSTYMVSEIENGLIEKIEKTSPTTGSMATYTKTSKITRLPQYLTINFVRFQWKATEKIKAKILKRLQQKLAPAKARVKEIAEKKAEELKKQKLDAAAGKVSEAMDVDKPSKTQQQILEEIGADQSLITDPGMNPSGQYDLVAVLTHVGRGANSGHYIGWVKQEATNNWWKFDDDKVSQVPQEDITKLEGGGDWHTAYMCLYRAKQLE